MQEGNSDPFAPGKVFIVHETYVHRGGEDESTDQDIVMLRDEGHAVESWIVSNTEITTWPLHRKARLFWETSWSRRSSRQLKDLLTRHKPDVIHFHNTLPIISPSAIRAAHASGVAVVMTLHNYRLLCPVGTFLRNGQVCEDCVTRSLLRGIVHGCYRDSVLQTAAVASMLAVHRALGTWTTCVDAYVALTEFMRQKLGGNGLPVGRIFVRSNAVRQISEAANRPDDYCVFIGRLSPEKGMETLLSAARQLGDHRIRVVGDGPLLDRVRQSARDHRFEVLGHQAHPQAMEILGRARVQVFPTLCYEGLPRVILESFAYGVPVVASRIGSVAEVITDGHDGFLVPPGDAAAFADRIRLLMTDDALRERMSRNARRTFEERYAPDISYRKLIEIYHFAMDRAAARRQAAR